MPTLFSENIWAELRVFLAVAKGKSFAQASTILGVSPKTITRHIKRLHDVLGAELLISNPTGVALTRTGQILAKQLAQLDFELFKTSEHITQSEETQLTTVRIGTTDALGAFFIAPQIQRFQETHPTIRVEICTVLNANDIRDNTVDMMLASLPMPGNDLEDQAAGYFHFLPFASKNYIARYGLPTNLNLSDHTVIDTPLYEAPFWKDWQTLKGSARRTHSADNSVAHGSMVVTGAGIGLLGNFMALSPFLVPLDFGIHYRVQLHVVASKSRLEDKNMRRSFRWLCSLFSSENPWFAEQPSVSNTPTVYDAGLRAMLCQDASSLV